MYKNVFGSSVPLVLLHPVGLFMFQFWG